MQNIQMMRSELHKEDPNMNMVHRSGATIEEDKGKQPEEDMWVRKAPIKELEFDLQRVKETFWKSPAIPPAYDLEVTSNEHELGSQDEAVYLPTCVDGCIRMMCKHLPK